MRRSSKHKKLVKKLKSWEWSKIFATSVAVVFGVYSIWCGIQYYNLSKLAIINNSITLPDATLAVTCVSVVLGALLSYLLYQMGLKNSRNKFGIDADGQPFKTRIVDSSQEEADSIVDIPEDNDAIIAEQNNN